MIGKHHRRAGGVLLGAALAGSVAATREGRAAFAGLMPDVAAATPGKRERAPRPGDRWGGCNDARAAGTAPIYRGEPGYRADMDGDDDGIACEQYRG